MSGVTSQNRLLGVPKLLSAQFAAVFFCVPFYHQFHGDVLTWPRAGHRRTSIFVCFEAVHIQYAQLRFLRSPYCIFSVRRNFVRDCIKFYPRVSHKTSAVCCSTLLIVSPTRTIPWSDREQGRATATVARIMFATGCKNQSPLLPHLFVAFPRIFAPGSTANRTRTVFYRNLY